MLAAKQIVSGPIARLEPDRIVVRRGEVVESYNPNYYRVLPEVDDGQVQRTADPAREAASR
ncbi:hypothetical protein COLU111180_12090 [Cohnella lubricantis]|nr:hypothetical protein [Cohnella lubricantis]